jgi:hypothetical protein
MMSDGNDQAVVIPEEPTDTRQIDSEFEIWILNRSKDAAFDD